MQNPVAYHITFTTYGTWLHGNKKGSVDRNHNDYGKEFLPGNIGFKSQALKLLKNPPVTLNSSQQKIVLQAILDQSNFRQWFAYAVHVRSNHVHVIVSGPEKPEKMLTVFKAYATRALRKSNNDNTLRYWTKHGSTKYLWSRKNLDLAVKYVKDGQGKMMAFGNTESFRAWSESDR